ncbi:short-chain dehydrogenase TIC 32, chloroplastic [Selaginella moellendorffii]|uniref:short-chain dehydrogenase TIC 32, chloroplastic n=1 Tax=Selaginella moellendorffii TaxID=88036 RepID=UPI000D1CFCE6|nr:short-chain dehydrogenase TIC 32, chloroplastic [Selaginella moellendorffii]XP_024516234.1 short-chain dehydrogenase TIC 32, chloroplastic [Selaginella moellendorffii]|eukprot:XP_024516233.1 short-chain dehydrogenase TIC 32, chloroplastic [Selaginella moellendorffii]
MVGFFSYFTGKRGPSGFGSSSTAEDVAQGISLHSQVAIITGSTSGIGFETARVLAKHGAHVVVPARKVKDSEGVRSRILKEFPDATVSVGELDLSSLASVRKFVSEFKALELPLNMIINNAGISSGKFVLSPEGLELDFATNHMGHFLLVELLLDDVIKTSSETGIEGRIVIVSSEAHKFAPKQIVYEKLNDKDSFSWTGAYGRSKLANIWHAKELARRLQERNVNVTANALHPGAIDTNLGRDFNKILVSTVFFLGKPFLKTVPQGAATTVYAAIHPSMRGVTGKYLCDCNEAECSATANDMKMAAELWEFSEKFVASHP